MSDSQKDLPGQNPKPGQAGTKKFIIHRRVRGERGEERRSKTLRGSASPRESETSVLSAVKKIKELFLRHIFFSSSFELGSPAGVLFTGGVSSFFFFL